MSKPDHRLELEWFKELNRRWTSGKKLSVDDVHRLNYLRSTYINEIRAEAAARYSDGRIVVETTR